MGSYPFLLSALRRGTLKRSLLVVTLARPESQITGMATAQQNAISRIRELDLEPIVYKLTVSEHGEPPTMTLEEADRNVVLYRQFLILNVLYPEQSIVPTRDLDEVWHTHILDTSKYEVDCNTVFGRMLHHFPYLGLRGPEDVTAWQTAFSETQRLFKEHFGVELVGDNLAACGESCSGSLCDGGSCDSSACTANIQPALRSRPRPVRV